MLKCFVMKGYPRAQPSGIHICDTDMDLDTYMDIKGLHDFYNGNLNSILNEVSFELSNLVNAFLTKDMYLMPQCYVCFYQSYNSDEGLIDDFDAILGDIRMKFYLSCRI